MIDLANLTVAALELMTPKALADIFNTYAASVGQKPVNRFADKPAALKRTIAVVEAAQARMPKPAPVEVAPPMGDAPEPKTNVALMVIPPVPASGVEARGAICGFIRAMVAAGSTNEEILAAARARFGKAKIPNNAAQYYRDRMTPKRNRKGA